MRNGLRTRNPLKLKHALGGQLSAGGGGPPPSYEGPLDIVPGAVVAYGNRALSAAMLGEPVYTILRLSDDTAQAFSSDAVTGDIAAAAITTFIGTNQSLTSIEVADGGIGYGTGTFDVTLVGGAGTAAVINVNSSDDSVSGINSIVFYGGYSSAPANPVAATGDNGSDHGTGVTFTCSFGITNRVSIWHDQSGDGVDLLRDEDLTLALPFVWVADLQGSRPGFDSSQTVLFGGQNYMESEETTAFPDGEFTVFKVVKVVSILNIADFPDENTYVLVQGNTSGATLDMYDGADGEALAEYDTPISNTDLVLIAARNSVDVRSLLVNGVALTPASNYDAGPLLPISGVAVQFSAKQVQEIIVYPSLLSVEDAAAVSQNIADYYGITLT